MIFPSVHVYVVRSGEVQYCPQSPTVNIAQYPAILPNVHVYVVRSGEVQYCPQSPTVNIALYPVILPITSIVLTLDCVSVSVRM